MVRQRGVSYRFPRVLLRLAVLIASHFWSRTWDCFLAPTLQAIIDPQEFSNAARLKGTISWVRQPQGHSAVEEFMFSIYFGPF